LSGTKESKYGVKRLLGSKWMVKLGGISFGIYLWHWVILSFYRYNVSEELNIWTGSLIIIVSIILSFLMTKFIEEPIRNSKNNRRSFKRLGVMLAINLLFIAGLLGSNVIQKNNLQQQVTDVNYPGALATVAEVQAEETEPIPPLDRKSTRLNSSHVSISYVVF